MCVCVCSLHVLNITPLSEVYLAKIFLPLTGLPLHSVDHFLGWGVGLEGGKGPAAWKHVEARLLSSLEAYQLKQSIDFPAAEGGERSRSLAVYNLYEQDLSGYAGREGLEVPDLGPIYCTEKRILQGAKQVYGWKSRPAWLLVARSPGRARMTSSLSGFECCRNHPCDLTLRNSNTETQISHLMGNFLCPGCKVISLWNSGCLLLKY